MKNSDLVKKSKFLSLILRHNPSAGNIILDNKGYAFVDAILRSLEIDKNELDEIVFTDNKKRYSYSDDGNKIRANQGHSININIDFDEKIPPKKLYHGTSNKNIDSILEKGILKMQRNYVHISSDYKTALEVGKRHGKPIVFEIRAFDMYNDGFKFFISENGVWLVNNVLPKYLRLIE